MKLAYTLSFIAAILLIQCLIGGTRLVFCIPSYAVLATTALLSVFSLRQPIAKPNLACLSVTAVFFAYILGRAATSPVPYLAWMDFHMVQGCLVVYLFTALYITRTRLRTAVIAALLTLAVVEVLIGLRQFKGADNWMPFGFIRSDYGGRASGTFISSITLAGYLEAVGIFALSLAIWTTWKGWARALLAYLAVACYVGVAITGSRGGYLSSAGSLFVLAVISLWIRHRVNPSRFAREAVIAAAVLAVGVGGAVIAMKKSTLLQQRLELIGKPDIRYYNWLAALDQFKVSPWVGTGAGTHLYFGRLFRRPPLQNDPEHAHNDYLELLAEFGLIGAVGMAVFIFVHLRSSFSAIGTVIKTAIDDPFQPFRDDRLAFQVGALTAISAFLIHSITDFNLHIPGHALIFAFIFGITANPVAEKTVAQARDLAPSLFRLALPALGVWLMLSAVPKWHGDYLVEKTRVALRNKEYDAAIALGTQAHAIEQRNPFLYLYIGEAYRRSTVTLNFRFLREPRLQAAVDAYRSALRLYPQDETFWVRMAQAYDGMGAFREAETAYLTAFQLDPNLGVLNNYYADHLAAMGVPDQAERLRKLGEESRRKTDGWPRQEPLTDAP